MAPVASINLVFRAGTETPHTLKHSFTLKLPGLQLITLVCCRRLRKNIIIDEKSIFPTKACKLILNDRPYLRL